MSDSIVSATETHMQKSIEAFKGQLAKLHTGRANPGLLEDLMVEYYGNRVPLKQIANISVPESRQLLIQPWDQGAVVLIEKAITTSNLGLNPRVEGRLLRVILPEVTEDRRKQLKKVIDEEAERCRVTIRAHRQDGIKQVRQEEQDKSISEDDSHRLQDEIQKKTDAANTVVDQLHKAKNEEILTV